ncbi:MAG: DUF58 domain-containing protein [Opitutales bacterium]|nr:DUF58 domain-containing protein [Opitutales bacterium]
MTEAEKTRAILKKVRQVEIRSRKFVDDTLVGAYHSIFKGAGIDFAEVREYQAGDDVRSIDWNVTARMDRPFLKTYQEERELTLMLMVDLSASGDFGSQNQSKRELAAEVACVLAFSATRNNDKVGLLLFTDEVELYIAPKKGRKHVLRVIREILFFEPEGKKTNIPNALRRLNRLQKRKAICFLFSDFLTDESLSWIRPSSVDTKGELQRMLRLTHQRHDLICIELTDPREQALPDVGIITLEDAESGELIEVNTSNRRFRDLYAFQNKQRMELFAKELKRSGIDHLLLTTEGSYVKELRSFFNRRVQRR